MDVEKLIQAGNDVKAGMPMTDALDKYFPDLDTVTRDKMIAFYEVMTS